MTLIETKPEADQTVMALEKSIDEQAYADKLFCQPCQFTLSVAAMDALPPADLPEVAFVGRSNVGKSSLINALTNRKSLAFASNTPGRTQLLNFFNLGDQLYLVDLPGYGYAKAPKALVMSWTDLIKDYLKGRSSLKRVFLLIDSRHGLKTNDQAMMKMLDKWGVSYQVVLTKSDKISSTALQSVQQQTQKQIEQYTAAHPELLTTSAEKKLGLESIKLSAAHVILGRAIEE